MGGAFFLGKIITCSIVYRKMENSSYRENVDLVKEFMKKMEEMQAQSAREMEEMWKRDAAREKELSG